MQDIGEYFDAAADLVDAGEIELSTSEMDIFYALHAGAYVFREEDVVGPKGLLFSEMLFHLEHPDTHARIGATEVFVLVEKLGLTHAFLMHLLVLQLTYVESEASKVVSLNLHPCLLNSKWRYDVKELLTERFGHLSNRVWLEITEYEPLNGQFDTFWVIWKLQQAGYKVAFDDYGDPDGHHKPWMLRFAEPQAVKFTRDPLEMLLGFRPVTATVQEGYAECVRLGVVLVAEADFPEEEAKRLEEEFGFTYWQTHS